MTSGAQALSRSVRLVTDIPELGLHCGEVGVVCSTWFAPIDAVEVEFQPPGLSIATRTLLLGHQIQDVERVGVN
jgi:hypothetical protein